jgi:hypothetical protein
MELEEGPDPDAALFAIEKKRLPTTRKRKG